MIDLAVRPVQLVEVDALAPDAGERCLDRAPDRVGAGRLAAARLTAGAGDLGGDDPVIPPATAGDPVADELFGAADGFDPDRVDRIHLGGVEDVHAGFGRHVDLAVRLVFGCLVSPGHGAEAENGNVWAALTQGDTSHATSVGCGQPSDVTGGGKGRQK